MPSLKVVLVENTAISASATGFVGILDNGVWYPNRAKAKEAEDNSKGEEVPRIGFLRTEAMATKAAVRHGAGAVVPKNRVSTDGSDGD